MSVGPARADVYVRVDNRLLHGQVVQFWIPYLGVSRLFVADDEVAANEAMSSIYKMAVPESVALHVIPVMQLEEEIVAYPGSSILVLLRDVSDAGRLGAAGFRFERLTLGNVHATPDRSRVTDSVYLSGEETRALAQLHSTGTRVEIQTFPGEILRMARDDEGGTHWSRS